MRKLGIKIMVDRYEGVSFADIYVSDREGHLEINQGVFLEELERELDKYKVKYGIGEVTFKLYDDNEYLVKKEVK